VTWRKLKKGSYRDKKKRTSSNPEFGGDEDAPKKVKTEGKGEPHAEWSTNDKMHGVPIAKKHPKGAVRGQGGGRGMTALANFEQKKEIEKR